METETLPAYSVWVVVMAFMAIALWTAVFMIIGVMI